MNALISGNSLQTYTTDFGYMVCVKPFKLHLFSQKSGYGKKVNYWYSVSIETKLHKH